MTGSDGLVIMNSVIVTEMLQTGARAISYRLFVMALRNEEYHEDNESNEDSVYIGRLQRDAADNASRAG